MANAVRLVCNSMGMDVNTLPNSWDDLVNNEELRRIVATENPQNIELSKLQEVHAMISWIYYRNLPFVELINKCVEKLGRYGSEPLTRMDVERLAENGTVLDMYRRFSYDDLQALGI